MSRKHSRSWLNSCRGGIRQILGRLKAARIGEDRLFPAAILLILFLLVTAAPPVPVPPGPDGAGPFADFGRIISREGSAAFPAFLFRIVIIVFLTLLLSGLVINLQGWFRGQWRVFPPGPAPRVPWGVAVVIKLAVYFIALLLLLFRLEKIFLGLAGIAARDIRSWLLLGNAFLQFAILLGLSIGFLRRQRRFAAAGNCRSGSARPSGDISAFSRF